MPMFRKKPVVIEAIHWLGHLDSLSDWQSRFGALPFVLTNNGDITIDTLEGEMRASMGDWIIRGVKGEFYPCKPDIFEKTYEAIDG